VTGGLLYNPSVSRADSSPYTGEPSGYIPNNYYLKEKENDELNEKNYFSYPYMRYAFQYVRYGKC
jgi:hypothetical protein